jgi:hypothetical protein
LALVVLETLILVELEPLEEILFFLLLLPRVEVVAALNLLLAQLAALAVVVAV